MTQVLGSSTFNEIVGGYVGFYWVLDSKVPLGEHPYPGLTTGTPILQMRGYTIGQGHTYTHEFEDVENYSVKDNLTFSLDKWGRQNFKIGGIYNYQTNPVFLCNRCMGSFDMQGGAVPANIEQIIPVWNDVSTWNLNALAPITRSYTPSAVGKMDANPATHALSTWVQNDWQMTNRLTLNLGLRYDLMTGVYAENVAIEPFLPAGAATTPTTSVHGSARRSPSPIAPCCAGASANTSPTSAPTGLIGRTSWRRRCTSRSSMTAVRTSSPIRSTDLCRPSTRWRRLSVR